MINKGKVVSLRKISKINFYSKNKLIFLMCFIFIIGVLFSALFYKKSNSVFNWSDIVGSYYFKRGKTEYLKIFLNSLLNSLTVLVILFINGTSVMGVGTIPLTVLIIGFASGGISSYLYYAYSLKGIAFNALVILPVSVLFFTLSFFAAKTSFDFSVSLSKITMKKISGTIQIDFKNYCNKYLVFIIATVFISLFDALLSLLFVKLFKF